MKLKLTLLSLLLLVIHFSQAQNNLSISDDAAYLPDESAMLDVKSLNKGLLIPRMSMAQRNLIGGPATGLLIFQTDNSPGFYYYDGSIWATLGNGMDADNDPTNELINSALLGGTILAISDGGGTTNVNLSSLVNDADADPTNEHNTGASLTETILGITDGSGTLNVDLGSLRDTDWLKSDNTQATVIGDNIYTNGNVGIGNSSPAQKLDIAGTIRLAPKTTAGTTLNRIVMIDDEGDITANDPTTLAVNEAASFDLSGFVVKPNAVGVIDLPGPINEHTTICTFQIYSTCDTYSVPITLHFKRYAFNSPTFAHAIGNDALMNTTGTSLSIPFDAGCGPMFITITLDPATNTVTISVSVQSIYISSGRSTVFRWQ